MSNTKTLTPVEIRCLKYWTPGPFAAAYIAAHCPDDAEKQIDLAYTGLAGCLDAGFLRHCYPADVYRPTRKGKTLIDSLRAARAA